MKNDCQQRRHCVTLYGSSIGWPGCWVGRSSEEADAAVLCFLELSLAGADALRISGAHFRARLLLGFRLRDGEDGQCLAAAYLHWCNMAVHFESTINKWQRDRTTYKRPPQVRRRASCAATATHTHLVVVNWWMRGDGVSAMAAMANAHCIAVWVAVTALQPATRRSGPVARRIPSDLELLGEASESRRIRKTWGHETKCVFLTKFLHFEGGISFYMCVTIHVH